MRFRKLVAVGLVCAALVSTAPAGAQTRDEARRRQEAVQRKRAAAAASLDALKASDSRLEAAVATLTSELLRAEARAAAAQQAVAAAEAEVAEANRRLRTIERSLSERRKVLVDRAVEAYMRPLDESVDTVLASRDLGEAARRRAMLDVVGDRDIEVIDALRAAEEDARVARLAAEESRRKAETRRERSQKELARVARAREDQARQRRALDARIRSFQAEVDGLAREEAELAQLIRQRQAARASRSNSGAQEPSGRVSGAGLIWPVRGTVTSEYGPRWGRMHEGIDISAPSGTPIRAAKAGRVIFVGQQGGYGNMTLIDHGGGFVTAYPHQSRFGTSEGASVAQGQVIGFVGCTGSCTGPHLHFETRVNGEAQNPRWYLP